MALRSVVIADLKPGPPPLDAAGSLDLAAMLGPIDPDTPLAGLLGLKPGDVVRIAGGKGRVVRASGRVEEVNLGN